MKMLEKLLTKSKGITSKTVPEVVKSLVDDNLLQNDKVGIKNCFLVISITSSYYSRSRKLKN